MAEPFLSEIRIFSFNFPPKGWAFCNGQFLPINQNQALFALLGTTYGGNGQTTFALPNLQGRVPLPAGSGHTHGQRGRTRAVPLSGEAGRTTFAPPSLQGRVPIHGGSGHTLGEAAGSTAVTISQQTMPQHL